MAVHTVKRSKKWMAFLDNALLHKVRKKEFKKRRQPPFSQPPFLRRNLNHVFDSCEKELQGAKDALDAMVVKDGLRRARYAPPTDAMIHQYTESDRPKLTIDSISLRPSSIGLDIDDTAEPAKDSRRDSGLTGVPHPDERPIPCDVVLNIHCQQPDKTHKTQVYYGIRDAQIFRSEDVSSRRRSFDIRLQSPFVIEASELKVTQEELRQDGSTYWKRKMFNRYTVTLGIACQDSTDSAEFLAQLEGGTDSRFLRMPYPESFIQTVWGDIELGFTSPGLPDLPPKSALLPIWRERGVQRQRLELPYGLRPNMEWTSTTDESILAAHHKLKRRLDSIKQMPTSPPFEDAESPRKKRRSNCSVKYRFWSGKSLDYTVRETDLKCAICFDDHSSVERLYIHYATHHEEVTIAVEDDDEDADIKVFNMQLRDGLEHFASDLTKDNFVWQAPRHMFDAAAYVHRHSRGQHTGWETEQADLVVYPEEVLEAEPQDMPSPGQHERPLAPVPPSLELEKPKVKDMLAVEVHDLPIAERKKHKVPDVPGVYFRRASSKQILLPGEMVSDSDQDQDEPWLAQRQRRDMRNLGLDAVTQAVHELVNVHLDSERPSSDVLVRDTMVRCARRHKSQLAEPRMKNVFRDILAVLQRARIISRADLDYCLQIIPSTATARSDVARANPAQSTAKAATHAGPRGQNTLFGQRRLICRRTNGSRQRPYQCEVAELVKWEYEHIKPQDIRPRHLDWFKFTRILDNHLIYLRPSDNIVCIGDRLAPLVTDEKDWHEALEQADREPRSDGALIFELHTAESYHDLFSGSAAVQAEGNVVLRQIPLRPCSCGHLVAAGTRGTIGCHDEKCSRNFHMACVGLQKRVLGWKCPGCA